MQAERLLSAFYSVPGLLYSGGSSATNSATDISTKTRCRPSEVSKFFFAFFCGQSFSSVPTRGRIDLGHRRLYKRRCCYDDLLRRRDSRDRLDPVQSLLCVREPLLDVTHEALRLAFAKHRQRVAV